MPVWRCVSIHARRRCCANVDQIHRAVLGSSAQEKQLHNPSRRQHLNVARYRRLTTVLPDSIQIRNKKRPFSFIGLLPPVGLCLQSPHTLFLVIYTLEYVLSSRLLSSSRLLPSSSSSNGPPNSIVSSFSVQQNTTQFIYSRCAPQLRTCGNAPPFCNNPLSFTTSHHHLFLPLQVARRIKKFERSGPNSKWQNRDGCGATSVRRTTVVAGAVLHAGVHLG